MQVTPAKKTSWSQYRALLGSPRAGRWVTHLSAARCQTRNESPSAAATRSLNAENITSTSVSWSRPQTVSTAIFEASKTG